MSENAVTMATQRLERALMLLREWGAEVAYVNAPEGETDYDARSQSIGSAWQDGEWSKHFEDIDDSIVDVLDQLAGFCSPRFQLTSMSEPES